MEQAAHGDARGPAAGKTADPGALNGKTGQRNASSKTMMPGRDRRPGTADSHAQQKAAGDSGPPRHAFQPQDGQRRGTHGHSRPHGKHNRRRRDGEPEIRGLRGPVERTPDVVYEPERARGGGKPAQREPHGETGRQHGPSTAGRRDVAGGGENRRDRGGRGKSGNSGGNGARNQQGQNPDLNHAQNQGQNQAQNQGQYRGRRYDAAGGEARQPRELRPLYAALDLGTNNCRLLIAIPQQKGRFRVIDGFSRIVRLGEGMAQSGQLSQAAMDRALEALKICAGKMISHDISRHRLIATEACRQAANGEAFLARVYEHTGMKLEIIDRRTEAYLAAEGCGSLIDRKAEAAVLFDIGGGSSELALVKRGRKNAPITEQITGWTSLPIGVVTLAERFGGREVDHALFERMVEEVRSHLAGFADNESFTRVWRKGRVHLLGTSGTVTTLAGIHLNLPRYERRLVDGLWMQSGDVDTVLQQLIAMDYDQRARSPCIGQERADLVMAGCAILEAIRRTWPCQTLRVADRGLREGALTQLMSADNAWLPPKKGRWPRKKQR